MFAHNKETKDINKISDTEKKPRIGIFGGGIAGVMSALECAKDGYEILLIEKNDDILQGTSRNQCYRLHTGLHYPDTTYKTSVKCLGDTIESLKVLPKQCYRIHKSRYYLMSNSLFGKKEMKNTAKVIAKSYKQLIQVNPQNKLLGEPDAITREVPRSEYGYVPEKIAFVDERRVTQTIKPILAMDIVEPQIKIDELRSYLNEQVKKNKNIRIITNSTVKQVKKLNNDFGYSIKYESSNDKKTKKETSYNCDVVINCAWENVEKLTPDEYKDFLNCDIRNRMKVMLHVKIPEGTKIPTSLFCYGPHAAISMLEDNTAIITWEPKTNVGDWIVGGNPPDPVNKILKDRQKQELLQQRGREILEGFSRYIPEFKDAKILAVRVGYVRTPVRKQEKFSIYAKNSSIHVRHNSGVTVINEWFGSCWIINEARKFTYGIKNSLEVRYLVQQELSKINKMKGLFDIVFPEGNDARNIVKSACLKKKLFEIFNKINHQVVNSFKLADDKSICDINKSLIIKYQLNSTISNFVELYDMQAIKGIETIFKKMASDIISYQFNHRLRIIKEQKDESNKDAEAVKIVSSVIGAKTNVGQTELEQETSKVKKGKHEKSQSKRNEFFQMVGKKYKKNHETEKKVSINKTVGQIVGKKIVGRKVEQAILGQSAVLGGKDTYVSRFNKAEICPCFGLGNC